MGDVMLRYFKILGNVLGTTRDLAGAVVRHATGRLPAAIVPVCRNNPAVLLDQTYSPTGCSGEVASLPA